MKIDLYLDVWPGQQYQLMTATTQPIAKSHNAKRYKITVNIPDSAIYGEIDGAAPVEDVVEVDKND